LLVACAWLACGSPDREPPGNVLLVVIDTLRADALDQAPYLARKAAEGRSFRNMFASSNWTLPAHVSLFTSRPYIDHNLPSPSALPALGGARLAPDETTLAGVLAAAGYLTAASTESGFVSRSFGLDVGFERFVQIKGRLAGALHPDAEHLGNVREALAGRDGRPFFLFVHTYMAHDYPANTDEYHRNLEAGDEPWVAEGNLIESVRQGRRRPPADFVKRLYSSGVRWADEFLERLVDEVRREGGGEPLLVVVTSDHGESFDEHPGIWGHSSSFFDSELRIPLVAWSETGGGPHGHEEVVASTLDVAPSILGWLGSKPAKRFVGRGDRFLDDPKPRESPASARNYARRKGPERGLIQEVLVTAERKYWRTDTFAGLTLDEVCFDRAADPGELVDRMDEDPACARFRGDLARLERSFGRGTVVVRSKNDPVHLRVGSGDEGLVAVQSAFPSAAELAPAGDAAIVWQPATAEDLLVLYPASARWRLRRLAARGRLVARNLILAELPREEARGEDVRLWLRPGDTPAPAAPGADAPELARHLHALGYLD